MKNLTSFALLTLVGAPFIHAQSSNEIDYGIEAVSGVRSDFNYRGFELAESTIELQVETEIAINNQTFLNLGAWYATETGDGNFDEAALFAHIRYLQTDSLILGLSATYRDIDHGGTRLSPVRDGIETGFFASWYFNSYFSTTAGLYYDSGADGLYSNIELEYSTSLSEKTFISLKTGISYVNSYYDRNGLNDAYSRASFTYNVSDTVSISPFVGTSILLDSNDSNGDTTYAGVWFEVSF